jgi:CubicO group peptidase (beta-lactamase class C family)
MARPVTPSRRQAGPPSSAGRRQAAPRAAATRRLAVVAIVAVGLAALGIGVLGGGAAPSAAPSGSPVLAAAGSILPVSATGSAILATPDASAGAGSPSVAPPSPSPSGLVPTDARAALERRLQSTLDRVRTKLAIPGLSATVLFPDGTSWSGASGFAQVATKTPVTPETAFAFASMSKTFTSALILQLVDEGKLSLADPAVRRLPAGLPITIDKRITIGMLLDHTSGLADYFLNPKIDRVLQRDPGRAWTATDALRYVGKPLSAPGAAWHYSNTNYLLLGLIAERSTGRPLATSIRERFLDKLGLTSTWYQAAEPPSASLADGYRVTSTKPTARPGDLADGSGVAPFRSVVTAAGGAGSLAGTSGDLARWARALYSGDVLGPIGTAILLSDFTKTRGYLPGVSYGFGVQALNIDGHPSLGHSGKLLGFRGAVRHFPIDGFTISVLTNQSRADPGAIVRSLLKVVAPAPVAPSPSPSPSPRPSTSASPAG